MSDRTDTERLMESLEPTAHPEIGEVTSHRLRRRGHEIEIQSPGTAGWYGTGPSYLLLTPEQFDDLRAAIDKAIEAEE